jgi:hypothetical protein
MRKYVIYALNHKNESIIVPLKADSERTAIAKFYVMWGSMSINEIVEF